MMRLSFIFTGLAVLCVCSSTIDAIGDMKFIGCFIDAGDRDLKKHMYNAIDNSPAKCYHKCRAENYQFFGVQNADQCWCGNAYGKHGEAKLEECSKDCTGDKTSKCGADWRNSVYSTGIEAPILEHLGCYIDAGDRDLKRHMYNSGENSPSLCYHKCRAEKYRYFGLQNADQCWCGDAYGKHGQAKPEECSKVCTGNHKVQCGNDWRYNLYTTGIRPPLNFIGCYIDAGDRDFTKHMYNSGENSPTKCYFKCKEAGFKYFGLQNADQCWCGNSYGKHGQAKLEECSKDCTGNYKVKCGSDWRNSVYSVDGGETEETGTTETGGTTTETGGTTTETGGTTTETETTTTYHCTDSTTGTKYNEGANWISKSEGFCYHFKCERTEAGSISPSQTDCLNAAGECVVATETGADFDCPQSSKTCQCKKEFGSTYIYHYL